MAELQKIPTWLEKYPDTNVKLELLNVHPSWIPMMETVIGKHKKQIEIIEQMLSKIIINQVVFPYPDHVFNALKLTALDTIKLVIFGQDPYFNAECHDKVYIPQAMGLSFSVQDKIKIPPSLANMIKNLIKFNHIKSMPKYGNLKKWAERGCLLLNSSMTVTSGQPNSHQKNWSPITDSIIKYISDNTTNVVFLLWGGPALKKLSLIDQTKHKVSISSHPSPLSCNNNLGTYTPFCNTDHAKVANDYLEECGKGAFDWTL